MRRAVFSVVLILACAVALAAGGAKAKSESWTGWISDSNCGVKGMSADHKACLEKCVKEKSFKYVFVDSKTKSIHAIHNQDAVKDADLGHEVVVSGSVEADKSIHVDSIKAKS